MSWSQQDVLSMGPFDVAVREARRRADAAAIGAAITNGRVVLVDDGMMLDDGVTGRLVPFDNIPLTPCDNSPLMPTDKMLAQIDAWPWAGLVAKLRAGFSRFLRRTGGGND